MKEIIVRSITGIILVIVIIGSILISKFVFAALFLIVTIIGTLEYYKMIENKINSPQVFLGTIISATIYILISLVSFKIISYNYLLLIPILFFTIYIYEMYRNTENPITNISLTLFGIIYISLSLSLINLIFEYSSNFHFVLAVFIIIWTSDTFAYLSGIKFGKHRLFERISPKKSWEGLFGGLAAAIIVGYIFSIFFKDINTSQWIFFALITSVAGVYGDLLQSMLKRNMKIKDSGHILPGHGGILDRFDAILIAMPVVLAYITLIT